MAMFKPLKDMLTDEYGVDFDMTNIAAVIGYFNGMILYDLHMFTHLAASFTLSDYAIGYAGLIGAVVGCQKLKPTPIVPSVQQYNNRDNRNGPDWSTDQNNNPPNYRPDNFQPQPGPQPDGPAGPGSNQFPGQ